MKHRKGSKGNIKKLKKPGFDIFAEKLMENLQILNEPKECPNCESHIENNVKICPQCGTELKMKTIEENMKYIRAYLQDVNSTMQEIIEAHRSEIIRLKEVIKDLKLKMGYEICSKCLGKGSHISTGEYPWQMFAFNPEYILNQTCEYCNGEGVIKKEELSVNPQKKWKY